MPILENCIYLCAGNSATQLKLNFMYDDFKVMDDICKERIKVPRFCYRFKVSLVENPEIFRYFDLPVGSCDRFLSDYFLDSEVFTGKKLEILGLFQID